MTSASFDDRLNALGIALPPAGAPVANYVPVVLHDGLATVSGQLPRDGRGLVTGKVGEDLSAEAARAAARLCGLSVIAQLRAALGGRLDRVVRCVQLTGFVNAGPAFTDHPQVVNGA